MPIKRRVVRFVPKAVCTEIQHRLHDMSVGAARLHVGNRVFVTAGATSIILSRWRPDNRNGRRYGAPAAHT